MFNKTRAFVTLCSLALVAVFLLSCGSSNSRPAGVLLVASQGASTVNSYAIDLGNGKLTQINKTAPTCASGSCGFPLSLVLDPSGATLFVLNQGTATVPPSIYSYSVNANGTATGGADQTTALANGFVAGDLALQMVRDTAGKFLFVVTQGNRTTNPVLPPRLLVFGIQSTSLSLLGQTVLTKFPAGLAVADPPSGSKLGGPLVYVTATEDLDPNANNDNTVTEFVFDSSANTVAALGLPYNVASAPSSVLAVTSTPAGGTASIFVYVANTTTNNVNIFEVCTVQSAVCTEQDVKENATLLPVAGSPVSVGQDPVAFAVDPTNSFLYVLNHNSNSVSGFRINAATGGLTALNPATVSTGSQPFAIAMHPTGEFLFVSNLGADNVSAFQVSTTNGALSSANTVTSSAQPSGLAAK